MSGNNKDRNNNRNHKIPEGVMEFAKYDFDKFKKKNKEYFDSKKEMRKDYFSTLAYDLSEVIDWVLRFGHIQQPAIQETKAACYEKLAGVNGPRFIKYLIDSIKDYGIEGMENYQYLPIILHEIIADIMKFNMSHDESERLENPDELFELSNLIMKKRLKKAKKKELGENISFDLLSIMPVPEAIKYGAFFRVRSVFDILYKYAEDDPKVDFEKAIKLLFDEVDYSVVVGYALQERKDKIKTFTETQKKLFNDMTEWTLNTLEDMRDDDIQDILENYIKVRKRDAAANKDCNRRYYISSLPQSMYPRIVKVVGRIKAKDNEAEKYL